MLRGVASVLDQSGSELGRASYELSESLSGTIHAMEGLDLWPLWEAKTRLTLVLQGGQQASVRLFTLDLSGKVAQVRPVSEH